MKKCFSMTTFFVIFVLSITTLLAMGEPKQNPARYPDIFVDSINADGFFAEQSSILLSNEFISDSKHFIKELAKFRKDNDINVIISLISDSCYYDYKEEDYKKVINELTHDSSLTKKEVEIVEQISTSVSALLKESKLYSELEKVPQKYTFQAPKFNPAKLDELLLQETDYNDEYKYYINLAFTSDPLEFIKRLSKEPNKKIKDLSSFISKEFLNKKEIDILNVTDKEQLTIKELETVDIINENIGVNSIQESLLYSYISSSLSGKWLIRVWMNVHEFGDRDYPGQILALYKPDGTLYWQLPDNMLLCRSVSGADPTVYQGNTPSGIYTGTLYGPVSPSSSYGPYKLIKTTPVSGQVVETGRTGIWIHGGNLITDQSKTWYPLRPTYGCVRIKNSDQQTLANKVQELINMGANSTGDVIMTELY